MTPPGMGAGSSLPLVCRKMHLPLVEYVNFPIVFRIVEHTENVNIDGKIY